MNKPSSKLSTDVFKKIEFVLDEFNDAVAEDELLFIGTIPERKKIVHDSFSKLQKYYRKPRECIYPKCNNLSITHSHTIPKSMFLKVIAENQHVLTPVQSLQHNKFTMKRVGINKASTFPGFCKDHESLFSGFETDGIIKSNNHVYLQVFRTICREIVTRKIQINILNKHIDKLTKKITKNGINFIKKKLGEIFIAENDVNINSLSFSNLSEGIAIAENSRNDLKQSLKLLENVFLPMATKEIEDGKESLAHYRIDIDKNVPVCLSGLGNFSLDDNGTRHDIYAILNILPNPNKVFLSITVSIKHQKYLAHYLATFMNHFNGPLNMIEAWMGYGPTHWFIKPSEWDALPSRRKNKILSDMNNESNDIGSHFQRSIIDSVRGKTLSSLTINKCPDNEIRIEKQKYEEDKNFV